MTTVLRNWRWSGCRRARTGHSCSSWLIPGREGTPHRLREPLELIEKLSILIPPPRFHALRCHRRLAPQAGWRSLIVPRPGAGAGQAGRGPAAGESARPGTGSSPGPAEPAGRQSWAALLARVCALDVCQCPLCGGRRRIVGVHTGGERLRVMLERLGLVSASPSAAPSRSPPRRGE